MFLINHVVIKFILVFYYFEKKKSLIRRLTKHFDTVIHTSDIDTDLISYETLV